MEPVTTAALIAGGASFLGNLFGSNSNKSTNETNLKIARENNQWSEQMMQKQMDYNTMMWEKNNRYNSAAAQRARLEEAGLNPYLMMNGGNAGVATSASSPSLPSPSGATMQSFTPDFSGIGSAAMDSVRLKFQKDTAQSQNRLTDLQSDFYAAKSIAEIGKMIAETKNENLKSKYQEIQNAWADNMMNQDYINKVRQNESLKVQIHNAVLTGIQQMQEIQAFPERNRKEIEAISADIALKIATKQLTLRQAKTEFFKQAESSMRATGQRINNELMNATFNALVEKAIQDTLPMVGKYGQNIGDWSQSRGYGQYPKP